MMGNITCTRLVNILLGIRPILRFFYEFKTIKIAKHLKISFWLDWRGRGHLELANWHKRTPIAQIL